MRSRRPDDQLQLGFDALLAASEADNLRKRQEREHAHLPGNLEEALPFYRAVLEKHHAAMLADEGSTVRQLRDEAHSLAVKLNNYEPGILAHEDAPGCALARLTCAPDGAVPLWGQSGTFVVSCGSMKVRIEMEGIFGIGAGFMSWLGFSAHAVDWEKPFLSETGYRSFLGVGGALEPGYTVERFCAAIIDAYVTRELKGKLRMIAPQYRGNASA